MTTARENKWSADAEVAMMGISVPVENEEHLKYMIEYITMVFDKLETAEKILKNAVNKYNSENLKVTYICANSTECGTMLTFAREEDITSEDGVLAWVENLDYPDCSELGYTFFERDRNGFIRRIG